MIMPDVYIMQNVKDAYDQACTRPTPANLKALADALHAVGLHPIPISHALKYPVVTGWQTNDYKEADYTFTEGMGILTGHGWLNFDFDTPTNADGHRNEDQWTYKTFYTKFTDLARKALIVRTGTGFHLYFKIEYEHFYDFEMGNKYHVEVRGVTRQKQNKFFGAYPPDPKANKNIYGAKYEVIQWGTCEITLDELEPVLKWLDELSQNKPLTKKPKQIKVKQTPPPQVHGALFDDLMKIEIDRLVALVEEAVEPNRKNTLFSSGSYLFGYAAGNLCKEEDFVERLREASLATGVEEKDVDRTIESARKKATPRYIPPMAKPLHEMGDLGATLLAANYYNGTLIYVFEHDTFYRFTGRKYERYTPANIMLDITSHVAPKYDLESERYANMANACSEAEKDLKARYMGMVNTYKKLANTYRHTNRAKAVVTLLQGMLIIPTEKLDQAKGRVLCSNGYYDLDKDAFVAYSKEDYYLQIGDYPYDAEAIAPRFELFLEEICDGDLDLVKTVMTFIGSAIYGNAIEHKWAIFYGKGRNGKSLLFEVLLAVLKHQVITMRSEIILESKNAQGGATPDMLRLKGAKLVYMSETGENDRLNVNLLKLATGQDSITARGLYRSPETFQPTHTLCLLTNNRPKVGTGDFAFWQRIIPIHFPCSFVEEPNPENEFERPIDKRLKEILLSEASGIINVILKWYRIYLESGIVIAQSCKDAVIDYKNDEDPYGAFVEEWVLPSNNCMLANEILDKFKDWFEAKGFHYSEHHARTVRKILRDKFRFVVKRNKTYYYCELQSEPKDDGEDKEYKFNNNNLDLL